MRTGAGTRRTHGSTSLSRPPTCPISTATCFNLFSKMASVGPCLCTHFCEPSKPLKSLFPVISSLLSLVHGSHFCVLSGRWDPRTSVALPDSDVFFLVALLRFNQPYPIGPPVESLISQNREILKRCKSNGYDFKLYFPNYKTEPEWVRHFGQDWARFVDRKAMYDPRAILSPGQNIFSRARPPSSGS